MNEIGNKIENVENKKGNIENVKEFKASSIENNNENIIETKPKVEDNKLKLKIQVSNRAKDPALNYPLVPKHSFMINSNIRKILCFAIEDDDDKNKLNSSF